MRSSQSADPPTCPFWRLSPTHWSARAARTGVGQNGRVPGDERREWTLAAAAALAALEAVLLIAVIVFVGHRLPVYALFLAAKFPFCVWLLRRRAGAFFALLLFEISGLGVALLAPKVALPLRALEIVIASTVLGLLWASAPLFPSPELPTR